MRKDVVFNAIGKRTSKVDRDRGESHYSDSSMAGDIYQRQMSRSLSRSNSVVSLMLASPVTLLTMSIRKGQQTQTKQIIKVGQNSI